jgi:hypothetical protein
MTAFEYWAMPIETWAPDAMKSANTRRLRRAGKGDPQKRAAVPFKLLFDFFNFLAIKDMYALFSSISCLVVMNR